MHASRGVNNKGHLNKAQMEHVDALKAQSNAAYAAGAFKDAGSSYTKWETRSTLSTASSASDSSGSLSQQHSFCRALDIDAANPVILSNSSAAFAGLKRFDQALQDATACLLADPNFVKGYSRQGLAYSSLKQPGPAEKHTDWACKRTRIMLA